MILDHCYAFNLLSPTFRESGGHYSKLIRLYVRPSVTKTLTWLMSSEVLMIEH